MTEFAILESGIRAGGGDGPRYLYFRLRVGEGEVWRVVALRELTYLTRQDRAHEGREGDDILGRQWAAVRGLYSAGVNFAYAAGGIFRPRHVGVVQWYGAVGEAGAEGEAADEALAGLEAVLGLLANYPQSRTGAPDGGRLQWYLDFVRGAPRVLVVLGHPDPRMTREGVGRDGGTGAADDDLAREQTEMFLRSLAARRKQFVFHVTADYVARGRLAEGLVAVARVCSDVASRQRGNVGLGFSIAIPFMAATSQAWTGTRGGGRASGRSAVDSLSESLGEARTEGHASTVGRAVTDGVAHTVGHATTSGGSTSTSTTIAEGTSRGRTDTVGAAQTRGVASTSGGATTVSEGWGAVFPGKITSDSEITPALMSRQAVTDYGDLPPELAGRSGAGDVLNAANNTLFMRTGDALADPQGAIENFQQAADTLGNVDPGGTRDAAENLVADGDRYAVVTVPGDTASAGVNARANIDAVVAGVSGGGDVSATTGLAPGFNVPVGKVTTTTTDLEVLAPGRTHTETTQEPTTSYSRSTSSSSSASTTRSAADTLSQSSAVSQGSSRSVARTTSSASFSSSTSSVSDTVSHSETHSTSETESTARTRSHALGRAHAEGVSAGEVISRGAGEIFGGSVSRGIVPGVSLSRSWQTEDDVAARVTEVLRGLQRVLDTASAEGGFMTQAAVFVEDGEAERLAAAAVGQAYHGLNVPTPVGARPVPEGDREQVRAHALACRPCLETDGDPFGGVLWTRYATLLTAGMLSAYTRPAWFEEGVATTVQEAEPPYAFYPDLEGEVFLGHQYSFETGQLTDAPLLLSRDRMFHTLFAADTGYGKSVAAMRLAYETTLRWRFRTVVLEFSTGWRALANAPGLEGHFRLFQLSPGGAFPLRWNPLEIGRHVEPEVQWRAFCDVFGGVARMGVRRQVHDFRRVLRRVYVDAGVLVRDREVVGDARWSVVRADEEALASVRAGTPIAGLPQTALQRIAVHRSRRVGLDDLYAAVEAELAALPPGDRVARPVMEGIAARLEPLIYGQVGVMFGKGEGTVAIADLAQPWGLCVIEGGDHLDAFCKTFLLAWFGWHAYQDAFCRRARGLARPGETVQIVYEELNKILTGVGGGDEEGEGGDYLIEQLSQQWIDSRKAGAWLHGITQVPSLVPRPVRQSCGNVFFGNEKGAEDRDIEVGVLARSEKGFADEPYRRWLARLPWAQMVVKLGYAGDQAALEPMKVRPAMLSLPWPSDEALLGMLGAKGMKEVA